MPKVSVLMPAFNVKNYLEMAVDSVLNQSYRDFELIVIDDGSTDGTSELLEQYKERDSRVRVYHIPNGGCAHARNLGVSYAQGDYIAFVDADDRLNEDYLEQLVRVAEENEADISMCGCYEYVEDKRQYLLPLDSDPEKVHILTGLDAYHSYYSPQKKLNLLLPVVWCKLFKRSLFDGITFPDRKIHEDSFTTYKLYFKANKIAFLNTHLYMYRKRSNSIMTGGWSRERIHDFIEQHEERISLLALMGIEITADNRNDYEASIRNCMKIALRQGYFAEYDMLRTKLNLLESWRLKK